MRKKQTITSNRLEKIELKIDLFTRDKPRKKREEDRKTPTNELKAKRAHVRNQVNCQQNNCCRSEIEPETLRPVEYQ